MSEIGVPVVLPSNTPERICTVSPSRRWVTNRDWPGLRLSSHGWMSVSASSMPGGVPSTTQPIAGPWLSPQVVKRNRWPKLLCDIPARRQPLRSEKSVSILASSPAASGRIMPTTL